MVHNLIEINKFMKQTEGSQDLMQIKVPVNKINNN